MTRITILSRCIRNGGDLNFKKRSSNLGNVYRAETKYIDPDTKKQRNYVVVKDNGKNVSVSKLKSIKTEKNPALLE